MADILTARAGLVTFGGTVNKPGGGVFTSYDLKGFFDALNGGSLVTPCLIAVLDLEQQTGWSSHSFLGGAGQIEFSMIHYCLYKKVAVTEDFTYIEPEEWQCVVNYQTAIAATPYLTATGAPAVHFAPAVHWTITRHKWGEDQWHGPVFNLDCKLNV